MLSTISAEAAATFIISLVVVTAQILQYIKANKANTKLDTIHTLVNSKYTDALNKYADALNTVCQIAERLAKITNNPEDVAAAQRASVKLEINAIEKQKQQASNQSML